MAEIKPRFSKTITNKATGRTRTVEYGQAGKAKDGKDRIRPGTVYVPKGAWMRDSGTGLTANGLIPGHKADLAGGACY